MENNKNEPATTFRTPGWTHRTTPPKFLPGPPPHTTSPILLPVFMASLDTLLNPESTQERDFRSQHVVYVHSSSLSHPSLPIDRAACFPPSIQPPQQNGTSSSTSSPPINSMAYERAAAESNYYAQTDIVMRPHEPHQDCPDTLACLPDTNGRPQHTLPVILRCAILGSPRKRLTIREIYAAMEKKYPYYKTAGPAWKVRDLLAMSFMHCRLRCYSSDPPRYSHVAICTTPSVA